MNRSSTIHFSRLVFILSILGAAFSSFRAGAQGVTLNTVKHETISQTQIVLNYNPTGGATGLTLPLAATDPLTLSNWGVTLNGVPALVTAVNVVGFNIFVTINASAINGAGIPFILPSQTGNVKVTYSAASAGKVGVLPSGSVPALGAATPSINQWPRGDCSDFSFSNSGIIALKTLKQCAPVTVDFYEYRYNLSMRLRNSSNFDPGQNAVYVQWGDGTPGAYTYGYMSDGVGNPSTNTFLPSGGPSGGPAAIVTARPTHTYPATYTLAAPKSCEFNAVIQPVHGGLVNCTAASVTTNTIFYSYDVDNKNTGTLNFPPSVTNSNRVCVGTNVGMFFSDATTLNCRPAVETSGPNTLKRWIRFVYGSQNYTTPSNIPDIRIIPPSAAFGPTTQVTNNDLTGSLIFPSGYFPTGAGGVGVPDPNGVIELPVPVTASTATAYMSKIVTTLTNNQLLGQRLYVRMEYWDVCNPYDGFSTANAISISNYVELVSKPTNLTAGSSALCYTSPSVAANFNVSGTAVGVSSINWYNKNPKLPGATLMTNSNGPSSTQFKSSDYKTAVNNSVGAPFKTDNTAGAYYSVWATQIVSSTNTCESSPIEVVIIQQPKLNLPLAPAGTLDVCNGTGLVGGSNDVAYTEGTPLTSKNIPVTTFANPGVISLSSDYLWSQSFGAGVTLTATNGVNTTAKYNVTPQPNPVTPGNIGILERFNTTPAIPIVNPNGPPDVVPTYSITPLACPTTVVNTPVNLYGQTLGGAIAPTTLSLCSGVTTGVLTLSGQRGNVLRWEKTFNAGAPSAIAGTAGVTAFPGEIPGLAGTYTYYAVVQNTNNLGPCAVTNSTPVTITVNPSPTAAAFNGTNIICSGSSTNLTVSITSGTSPFVVTYKANAGPNIVVNAYTTGANISVSPTVTTTYTLVSVVDSKGCPVPAAGLTGAPIVTISNPASATLSGTANICPGASTDLAVAIVGGLGATPYKVTLKANGVDMAQIVGYNDSDPITVNPLVTTTYTIKEVFDANNCPALAYLPAAGVKVTVGSTPTSATFSGGTTVCKGATVNLKLNITGGVGPYSVTVTPSSGPVITFTKTYVNNSNIPVPTTAVGTINYNVTFVADNCGNPLVGTPAGNPQAVIVNDVPVGTAKTVANICSGSSSNVDIAVQGAVTLASTYTWTAVYQAGLTGGAASGSGANIVTGPLVNTTGVVKNASFSVTAKAAVGGCNSAPFILTLPVDTEPVGSNQTTLAQCSNSAFSFDPATVSIPVATGGNGIASTFTWTGSYPAGLTVVTAGTGTGAIAEKLQNLTGAQITATYNVTPKSIATGCVGAVFQIKVPVNPQPTSNDVSGTAVCSNIAFSYDPQAIAINVAATGGNSVASTFTWTAAYDAGLTGGVASGNGNVTGNLTNTTAGPLNAVYTVTPKASTGGCTGNTFKITVPINAKAVITTQPIAANACITDNVSFTIAATGPGITYKWQENGVNLTDGTVGVVTYAGTSTATLTISNVTAAMSGRNYKAILTTTGACNVTSTAVTLTVSTLPPVTNVTPAVCSDVPGGTTAIVNLTLNSTTINSTATVTYWKAYDVATKTFSSPITPGTALGQDQKYTVAFGEHLFAKVVSGASCVNVATVDYNVKPRPNDNVIKDGTGNTLAIVGPPVRYDLCASNSSILFQTDGNVNPGSSFSWTVPSSPDFSVVASSANIIVMKFPNPTEGTASPYATTGIPIFVTETLNGCAGNPVQINVHVLSAPAPSVISGDNQVCDGSSANYSVVNVGGSTYSWTLPPGAVITSLPVTANAITVQMSSFSGSVTVTSSNGTCLSAPAAPFAVTVVPRPTMTKTVNPICSGSLVSSGVTLGANLAGSTFNWIVASVSPGITGSLPGDFANGVLSINQTPINVSGIAGSITYTVTPIGPAPDNCAGTPQTFTVVVNPEPVLALTNKTLCSKEAAAYEIKLSPPNLPSTTQFRWGAPVMSDGSSQGTGTGGAFVPMGAAGTFHINSSFVNTTAAPITATYIVEAQAGSCTSSQSVATRTFKLTINPEPVGITPVTAAAVCSGNAFTYDPQVLSINAAGGNNVVSTFTWTASYDAGISGGLASGTGNISGTLTNSTGTLNATYTITPKSVAGLCTGTPFIIKVPVNPQPVATPKITANICSGAAFTFDPQAVGVNGTGGNSVPSTFMWTATYDPALSGGIASGSGNVFGTLVNKSGSVAKASFLITPKAVTGGCVGTPFTIDVPINSEPVATDKSAPAVCSNVAFSYDPQTLAINGAGGNGVASSFTWTAIYDAGLTGGAASGTANVGGTLVNLTGVAKNVKYTVTPKSTAGGCSGGNFDITVQVNPQPVATSKTAPDVCSGDAIDVDPQLLAVNGAGGNSVPSSFTWTATYQTGLTGGVASGTGHITGVLGNVKSTTLQAVYTITPTATTGGCAGATFQITVNVNPQPVGAPLKNAPTVCSKTAFVVDPQVLSINSGGNSVASTFEWTASYDAGLSGGSNNGTDNITDNLTNLTSGALFATYTVTPTATTGGCEGNTFQIKVQVNPEPVGGAKSTTAVCSKVAFSFDPQAISISAAGGNSVASTFTWTAAYDVGLTGGVASGTGNVAGTLTNLTGGQLFVVYTVTPTASTGGCAGAPFKITVPVNPQPVATNKTVGPVCSTSAFSFDPQTIAINGAGGNGVASTFSWSVSLPVGLTLTGGTTSGTGGIAGTISNVTGGTLNATYTITPTATTGGCAGSPFDIIVKISPQPVGVDKDAPAVCSNTAYAVDPQTLSVSGGGNSVTSTFTWTASFDSGLTGGTTSGTGNVAGNVRNLSGGILYATYTVTPKSSADGCVGATFKIRVPINPEPKAVVKTLTGICSLVPFTFDPQLVSINAAGGNNVPSTFTWTAVYDIGLTGGVSSGSSNIAGTLTNTTGGDLSATFTVTPKSQTGSCVGDDFQIIVKISPQPVGIDVVASEVCSNSGFTFDPQTLSINAVGGNGVNSTFMWTATYDAGLTGGVPSGSGNVAGTLGNITGGQLTAHFLVTPSASPGGCTGAPFKIDVPVNPQPVGAAPALPLEICSGAATNVNFNSMITNGVASVYKYTLTADFAADLSPVVNPGTFDRTTKSAANSSEVFFNRSNHDVTLTYTVTPFSSPKDCQGTPFVVKVKIHPEPVGSNFNDPNCNSTLNHSIQTQITNGITGVFTYVVTSSDEVAVPTPAGLDRTVASDALITDSFVNVSGSPVTVTYTITAFNKAFPACAGATTFTYNVIISPKPVGVPTPVAAKCSDELFTIDPQIFINPSVASTFTWTVSYDGGPTTAGSGVITASFQNKSNAVKSATYMITPTASTGCVGDPFMIVVPISPEPVIDPALATPIPICSTNPASTNPTGIVLSTTATSVAAASYNVKLRSIDPLLVGTPTVGTGLDQNAIKNDKFRNTTSAQLKVIYAIVPIAATNCVGDTVNVTVLVNPEPVVDPATANPAAVCSQDKTNIVISTAGSSVAAASYIYISRTIPAGLVEGPLNAIPTLVDETRPADVLKNDSFTNQTAGVLVVDYVVRPKSGQGCYGESFTIHQAVNAEPVLQATPPTVCSGVATGVSVTNKPGTTPIASYEYVSISIPGGIVADGGNVLPGVYTSGNFLAGDKFIYSGSGTAPKFVTYFIKPTSVIGSCPAKATQQVQVQILPSPGVADGLDAIVCSTADAYGKNLTFAVTGPAALSYKLVPVMDPALIPVVFNPATRTVDAATNANDIAGDKFTNPTNTTKKVIYNVTPYTGTGGTGCEGAVKQITVTVEPTITAVPMANDAICSSDGVTINTTTMTLTSLTVPSAGPITFNYTAVSSIGSAKMTGFQPSASNLAQGYVIQDRLVNSSNAAATVTYTITPIANGAKGGAACNTAPAVTPQIVVITVEPKPKLVAAPLSQTICYNAQTNIALSTPTTPSTGTVAFNVISAVPEAGVAGTPKLTPYASTDAIKDTWVNDAPDNQPHNVVYTLQPVVSGGLGCSGDLVTITITVNPQAKVIATLTTPAQICSNGEVSIDLTPSVDGTLDRWTTLVTPAGSVVGAAPGAGDQVSQTLRNTGVVPAKVTYIFTPKANNCTGPTTSIDVIVNPIPKLGALPNTVSVCYNSTLNIPLTSTVTPSTFTWQVDPDPSSTSGAVAGTGSTINQLLLNGSDSEDDILYSVSTQAFGCNSDTVQFVVKAAPQMGAAIQNTETWICAGQTDFLQFQFAGQGPFKFRYSETTNGVTTPHDITNAPNFKSIKITPIETTTYTLVSLTDAFGCAYGGPFPTYTLNVSNFVASFTFSPPDAPDSPLLIGGHSLVTFTNTTIVDPVNDPNIEYTWDFGDDATPATLVSSAITIPVDYTSQGQKVVTLTIRNVAAEAAGVDCGKQISHDFVIKIPPLVVGFTAIPTAGCLPNDIVVTSNSSTGDVMEWTLKYEESLYETSNAIKPVFHITAAGEYKLTLHTYDSKTGQTTDRDSTLVFEFHKSPTASIAANPTTVFVPDTQLFVKSQSSVGTTSVLWDFDDQGHKAISNDTSYFYQVEGRYNVVLTAYQLFDDGVTCSGTDTVQIIARQGGISKIPNAFTPDPTGANSGEDNGRNYDIFLPNIKGAEEYNLQIYDRWGNLLFESNSAKTGWNGYKDGKILPAGVYVYKITLRLSDGQRTTQVGDVTLIR